MSHAKGSFRYEGVQPPWQRTRDVLALVVQLARRHLAIRYHGSALGPLWTLLNPLLMMAVYGFLFTVVIRGEIPGIPFPAFFLTGYLAWNVISLSVANNVSVVLECKGLIDSHRFPNWTLPVSRVAAAFFNLLLVMPLLLVANALMGVALGWELVLFPVAGLFLFAFAAGVALLVAATTPFFRDLQQLVEVAITILYFASPILYPYDKVASYFGDRDLGWLETIYLMNPITGLVEMMHFAVLGMPVHPASFVTGSLGALLVLAAGAWQFRQTSPDFNAVI